MSSWKQSIMLREQRKCQLQGRCVKENGTVEKINPIAETKDGACKVYANGYAVYRNETGTTVLWLHDCCSYTYWFTKGIKDSETLWRRYFSLTKFIR